jgi:hypothetical protein
MPWPRLEHIWATLSVSGSFDEEGKDGVGMILRNSSGEVIFLHANVYLIAMKRWRLNYALRWKASPLLWSGVHPNGLCLNLRSSYGHLFDEVKRLLVFGNLSL